MGDVNGKSKRVLLKDPELTRAIKQPPIGAMQPGVPGAGHPFGDMLFAGGAFNYPNGPRSGMTHITAWYALDAPMAAQKLHISVIPARTGRTPLDIRQQGLHDLQQQRL